MKLTFWIDVHSFWNEHTQQPSLSAHEDLLHAPSVKSSFISKRVKVEIDVDLPEFEHGSVVGKVLPETDLDSWRSDL